MTNAALRDIEEQLRRVAIHLTWNNVSGRLTHGTAFFATADGVALTAFHNIAETLAVNTSGWLAGRWQHKDLRFRWKLPEPEHRAWQEEHDIAVLQVEDVPIGLVTLTAGYLDPDLSESRRRAHWSDSRVVIAGFCKGTEYELGSGSGRVVHENPLSALDVRGKRLDEVLNFRSSIVVHGTDDGPGLSGSPVYSIADGAIIGVAVAARTDLSASELWPVHKHWESIRFLTPLKVRPEAHRTEKREIEKHWTRAALAACVLLIAALAGWMWRRQTSHTIPRQLTAEVTRLQTGRTEPVQDGSVFNTGERVRFHFTSPANGHFYVVDQEIVAGQAREPLIIYPTLRTGVGSNRVKAGEAVDFPGKDDAPPYIEAEPAPGETAYEGELLTLLVFPEPLSVTLKTTPIPLEPALFSLDGLRPREFIHPLAPSADAVAIRRIRLRVGK